MTDINFSVGFVPDQESIRRVQSEINRQLRDVSPEISVDIDNEGINRLRSELRNITVEDIEAGSASIENLRRTIENRLRIEIRDIDPAQRTLNNFRSEVERSLQNLQVAVGLRADLESRAGSGGIAGNALTSERQQSSRDIRNATRSVVAALQAEALATREVTQRRQELVNRNLRVEDELIAIRRQQLSGEISVADAIRRVARLRANEAEGDTADVTRDLQRTELERLQAVRRQLINENRRSEITQSAFQQDVQNERSRRQLNAVIERQRRGEVSARTALNRISSLQVRDATSLGQLVGLEIDIERRRLNTIIQTERIIDDRARAEREAAAAQRTAAREEARLTRERLDVLRARNRQLRAELNLQRRTGGGAGAAPSAPNVGGAGNVGNTARDNARNLRDTAQGLEGVNRGTRTATNATREYARTVRGVVNDQRTLNQAFGQGQGLAFDFGRQVSLAARRLLAWAAPAQLIFSTISALRNAVGEIIRLDTQTRRLIFFSDTGGIVTNARNLSETFEQQSNSVQRLSVEYGDASLSVEQLIRASQRQIGVNQQLVGQTQAVINVARQQGLALRDVAEAFVTVARVGQLSTDNQGQAASAFTSAALSLVRLEAGALGATEAVRGLQAIQAQFFGGQRGTVFSFLADDAAQAEAATLGVSSAAALLSVTSAGSSASVSELIDATTRLGSAFVNIQGLNFPQTLAILGEAFTATGATTGRLTTALRQASTLIVRNASAIKELTDIDVANVDGTVRGFESLLEVLERINETSGTLESDQLTRLIGDRRNAAIFQALAANADRLRAAFERFNDPVERINRTVAAQLELFQQNRILASSLEGRINSLRASFVELVTDQNVREIFSTLVTDLTNFTSGVRETVAEVKTFASILIPLGTVALVGLVTGIRNFTRGVLDSVRVTLAQNSSLEVGTRLLSSQATLQQGINVLKGRGLLTDEQANVLQIQKNAAVLSEEAILQAIRNVKAQISAQDVRTEAGLARQNSLIQAQIQLERQLASARQAGAAAVQNAEAQARGAAATGRLRGRIGAAFVAGVLLAGPAIESELESRVGEAASEGFAVGVQGGIIGSLVGGARGAIIGALIGIFATAVKEAIRRAIGETEDLTTLNISTRAGADAQNVFETTRATLDATVRLQSTLNDQARVGLEAQQERIFNLRNEAEIFRDLIGRGQQLTDEQQLQFETVRARLAAETQILREREALDQRIRRGIENEELANRLLRERAEINRDLVSGQLSVEDAVLQENRLRRINNELSKESISIIQRVRDAQEASQVAAARTAENIRETNRRLDIQRTAFRAIATLARGVEGEQTLRVTLEEAEFNAQVAAIQERIRELRSAVSATAGDEAERLRDQIRRERESIADLRVRRFNALINNQRRILDDANRSTRRQIDAWRTAAFEVTEAFENVVDSQASLAQLFGRVGEDTREIIRSTFDSSFAILDNIGTNLSSRLNTIVRVSEQELGVVRDTFQRQISTIGSTFTGLGDVSADVGQIIDSIATVIRNSDREIADERRGFIRVDIAQQRALSQLQRQQFNLRVQETRREIELRRNLFTQEIEILRERQQREREIDDARRSAVENFGQLLIESPERFQETVDNINLATRFFRGITDTNIESLRNISDRLTRIREQGGQQATSVIQRILQGLQGATQFNRGQIIQGVSNRQLQSIFSRIQVENLGDLSNDLRRQEEEANAQTQLQRQIQERQQRLVDLAEFDANLQRAQVTLAQADAQLALRQRNIANERLARIANTSERTRIDFVNGLQALLAAIVGSQSAISLSRSNNEFTRRLATNLRPLLSAAGRGQGQGLGAGRVGDINRISQSLSSTLSAFLQRDTSGRNELQVANDSLRVSVVRQEEAFRRASAAITAFTGRVRAFEFGQRPAGGAGVARRGVGTQDVGIQAIARFAQGIREDSDITDALNSFRFIPREIQQILDRQRAGGQLTSAERSRIRELERRFGTTTFGGGARGGGGRRLARRLFRDEETSARIISDFRRTLADSVDQNEFIDRARRLRGEGARGVRNIDVGATRRFLEQAGFVGAARQVSGRDSAARQLDNFIRLSERLAQEQGRISGDTQRLIVRLLGQELVPELQVAFDRVAKATTDTVAQTAAEENRRRQEEQRQFIQSLNQVNESIRTTIPQSAQAVQTALSAGGQEISNNISTAVQQAVENGADRLRNVRVGVDVGQITAEVQVRTPDALDAAGLTAALQNALSGVVADAQQLEVVSRQLAGVISELVRKGVIRTRVDRE